MLEMSTDRTEQNKKKIKETLATAWEYGKVAMGAKERPNSNEIRGKEVE